MAIPNDLPWAPCDYHCLPGAVAIPCPVHNRHLSGSPAAGLPAVERIEALEVRPGDTIVATPNPDVTLTNQMQAELAQALGALWPGHKVLVAAGFSLGVVRPDPEGGGDASGDH
jgi:hypothetical protein